MQEADTDDHQGTLGFEEFCAFYKMMSTRRDLYLLMLTYSDHKDHLGAADLQRFLEVEQKVMRPRRPDPSPRGHGRGPGEAGGLPFRVPSVGHTLQSPSPTALSPDGSRGWGRGRRGEGRWRPGLTPRPRPRPR